MISILLPFLQLLMVLIATMQLRQVEGTNTIANAFECFGGHDPEDAEGAAWYSYTPGEDGIMAVSSCGTSGADTRVWIFDGDCQTLPIQGSQ